VGHSLGGWTAAAYAIREPHRVKRLVLVDSGGFTVPQRSGEAQRLAVTPTDRPGARRLLDLLFFRKPFPPMGLLLDAVGRSYRSPNVVETVARLSESDGLLGRESELPHGTVLIWGERETLFPLADARRTAARIPGARLLVVRGVGHDGPMEAPRVFQRALSAALSGERLGAADR
jgi:pimeloyl-ACP methyl ester carboxylesterase